MRTLQDIAKACVIDKHKKRYLEFYEQTFSPIRSDAIKLFEIGIFKGASMKMWVDYFPNAIIVGMDIEETDIPRYRRVTVLQGDQADKARLMEVGEAWGPFDIVIDDGGHTMHQQQTSLGVLFKFVKPGGIYIIEDLHIRGYWGDHYNETKQITTWQMAADYEKAGVILSPSMSDKDRWFLMDHIQKCERFNNQGCRFCYFRRKR